MSEAQNLKLFGINTILKLSQRITWRKVNVYSKFSYLLFELHYVIINSTIMQKLPLLFFSPRPFIFVRLIHIQNLTYARVFSIFSSSLPIKMTKELIHVITKDNFTEILQILLV